MRILFLTHRVPFPPDKGDRIRSYNIIKFLANSHTISLMSLAHEPVHADADETLRKYCGTVDIVKLFAWFSRVKSCCHLLTRQPLTLSAFYSRRFHTLVKEKIRDGKFDLIYIYSSSMAQYVLAADHIPKLMDFVDVDSEKWFDYAAKAALPMKLVYYVEGRRLRCFEKAVTAHCDQVVFASERELKIFERIVPQGQALALPNGVKLSVKPCRSWKENQLVFVGAMDYFPNIDAMVYFTREILPLIQKQIPEVKLLIVGRSPSRQVRALNRLPHVVVTGTVEAVESYLRESAASVIPLRIARGIQNKILEAMANGVPVITTTAALEGIQASPGRDLLVGDNPQEFADLCVAVMRDKSLRQHLVHNALQLVRRDHNWNHNLGALNKIVAELCT